MATLTRDDLAGAVADEAGLTRRDARRLVDTVIEEIAVRLGAGEAVKITGFGSFNLRDKGERPQSPHSGGGADIAPPRGGVSGFPCAEEADRRGTVGQ